MKKLLFIFLLFFSTITLVHAEDDVTIYLFVGKGCEYCNEAMEYLYNHIEKYPGINVKTYEVRNNEDNNALFSDLKKIDYLEASAVPYILVSDSFYLNGYPSGSGKLILDEAVRIKESGEYNDVVKSLLINHPNAKAKTLKEALISEGIIYEKGKYDYLLVGGIFGVVIVLCIIIFKKGFNF